ncbi:allophanate hydrolase, partial [Pseudomonas syringae]|nr:allophanate hydrolase [Pseudomonas syringae]
APIGSKVRFVQCSYDEAVEALDTNHAFIEDARRMFALRSLQGHRR